MQAGSNQQTAGRVSQRDRKVTCQFRRTPDSTHCCGINSVLCSPDGSTLFTASRDSTIKRWKVQDDTPQFEVSFERHLDWVNDIVLLGDVLVSCSSDRTVNVWKASQQGQCLATFLQHSDYVTCLGAASQQGWVASAGLRGEILLWDLHAGTQAGRVGKYPQPCELCAACDESIYALAISPSGKVLASGCTNKAVYVWDPRQEGPVMMLKGHTGNVRALSMSSDGSMLLSGGSDGKIRQWDLGQQRCNHGWGIHHGFGYLRRFCQAVIRNECLLERPQVFNIHADSVWSLKATDDFRHMYSSSRDGTVLHTCLSSRVSSFLLHEEKPILSIAPEHGLLNGSKEVGTIWVGTTSSDVHGWKPPSVQDTGYSPGHSHTPAPNSPAPAINQRRSMTLDLTKTPLMASPSVVITGLPPLVQNSVLNDRRHVLTKDADGHVELWDITRGVVVKNFGSVSLKDAERKLFQVMSVPQWFTTDTKTGSLQIHFDSPQCFSAEIYAQDLGVSKAADDVKLNFGEQMLKGLFNEWATMRGTRSPVPQSRTSDQPLPDSPHPFNGIQGHFVFGNKGHGEPIPIVVGEATNGLPWRRRVNQFDGSEADEDLPTWPAEGSQLPAMLQTRLNAPRILRIAKVASYTLSKLAEQNIAMVVQPPIWDAEAHGLLPVQLPANHNSQGLPVLELTCNKMAVPFEMSLEAVRAYIWKRSDDLVLEYVQQSRDRPAPLPSFAPNS